MHAYTCTQQEERDNQIELEGLKNMGCRYCCEGASIFYRFYRAVLYFVDAMFDDNTGTQSRHLICIDKVFKSSLMNYKMAKTTKGSGFSMFTLKRLA